MNPLLHCANKIAFKLFPKLFLKVLLTTSKKRIEKAENSGCPEEEMAALFMNPYLIAITSLEIINEKTSNNIKLLDKVYEKWSKENDE